MVSPRVGSLTVFMLITSSFRDSETQAELEVQEKQSLLEWFANEYKRFGCTLEFVTNKSQVRYDVKGCLKWQYSFVVCTGRQ